MSATAFSVSRVMPADAAGAPGGGDVRQVDPSS